MKSSVAQTVSCKSKSKFTAQWTHAALWLANGISIVFQLMRVYRSFERHDRHSSARPSAWLCADPAHPLCRCSIPAHAGTPSIRTAMPTRSSEFGHSRGNVHVTQTDLQPDDRAVSKPCLAILAFRRCINCSVTAVPAVPFLPAVHRHRPMCCRDVQPTLVYMAMATALDARTKRST